MTLTLEQLAVWLACTHEPDTAKVTPAQEEKFLASLSKEELAKSEATRSEARRGFLEGVNDRISQMAWWSEDDRKKVDAVLEKRGLPDIQTMELLLKKK